MAWIDYKKAYGMVPHSCIKECLDFFVAAENIKTLLVNSMEKWRVMLCAGNSELEVDIKRGSFQGDSLSPLVFVLALIPLSLILRKAKAAYEFSGSKEKINNLLFMDDLKLCSRNEKGLDSLVQTIRILIKISEWSSVRIACYVSDRERQDCEISWYRVARW